MSPSEPGLQLSVTGTLPPTWCMEGLSVWPEPRPVFTATRSLSFPCLPESPGVLHWWGGGLASSHAW